MYKCIDTGENRNSIPRVRRGVVVGAVALSSLLFGGCSSADTVPRSQIKAVERSFGGIFRRVLDSTKSTKDEFGNMCLPTVDTGSEQPSTVRICATIDNSGKREVYSVQNHNAKNTSSSQIRTVSSVVGEAPIYNYQETLNGNTRQTSDVLDGTSSNFAFMHDVLADMQKTAAVADQ